MHAIRKLANLLSGSGAKFSFRYICKKHCASSVSVNSTDDRVELFKNNVRYEYPHVWLRDNCQCEQCFHPNSRSRIIDWKYFDVKAKPTSVMLKNDMVEMIWNDGHKSEFPLTWLKERSFNEVDRQKYTQEMYRPKRVAWNKENFDSVFRKFNYDDVMKNNSSLRCWLQWLDVHGVALITDVPESPESCRALANRVEFQKRTHYGEEFIVKAKPGTTNVAYLSSNLQIHTDLPYYEYKPGVNLLHCLTQTSGEGGENILSDGLFVANKMKRMYKENYEILKGIEVDWEDYGEENGNRFHSIYRAPVICENGGEIIRINYSTPQRGSHFNQTVDKVKLWYESLRIFVDMLHEESISYKVNEKEILCFDNIRLLHGRTQYNDIGDNIRYIIGIYLDWDFIRSRIRVSNE